MKKTECFALICLSIPLVTAAPQYNDFADRGYPRKEAENWFWNRHRSMNVPWQHDENGPNFLYNLYSDHRKPSLISPRPSRQKRDQNASSQPQSYGWQSDERLDEPSPPLFEPPDDHRPSQNGRDGYRQPPTNYRPNDRPTSHYGPPQGDHRPLQNYGYYSGEYRPPPSHTPSQDNNRPPPPHHRPPRRPPPPPMDDYRPPPPGHPPYHGPPPPMDDYRPPPPHYEPPPGHRPPPLMDDYRPPPSHYGPTLGHRPPPPMDDYRPPPPHHIPPPGHPQPPPMDDYRTLSPYHGPPPGHPPPSPMDDYRAPPPHHGPTPGHQAPYDSPPDDYRQPPHNGRPPSDYIPLRNEHSSFPSHYTPQSNYKPPYDISSKLQNDFPSQTDFDNSKSQPPKLQYTNQTYAMDKEQIQNVLAQIFGPNSNKIHIASPSISNKGGAPLIGNTETADMHILAAPQLISGLQQFSPVTPAE